MIGPGAQLHLRSVVFSSCCPAGAAGSSAVFRRGPYRHSTAGELRPEAVALAIARRLDALRIAADGSARWSSSVCRSSRAALR